MTIEAGQNPSSTHQKIYGHAVVIGSSIAGLTAARVLTDHFERVTLIERDRLPAGPDYRAGVPQARHVHVLRLRGQRILEAQFPGLVDELIAKGASVVNAGDEADFFLFGSWREPKFHSAIDSVSLSRPLLEGTIYRRLMALPGVTVLQQHEAIGLQVDAQGERVTGVRLRRRGTTDRTETALAADLVIDASGRGSRAPQWLADLGYTPPTETIVDASPGYATRIYRRPLNFQADWKTSYIISTPPNNPRGGVIAPIEGNLWLVTLIGLDGDHPPTDEAGFLEFARSLPSRRLYDAICQAEPLGKIAGFGNMENRLRHYERLTRYLEGFLVMGDGVAKLNPTHAQGMTVAAMGSQVLDHTLQAHRNRQPTGDLTGLARAFQTELVQVVGIAWNMATSTDRRWPKAVAAEQKLGFKAKLRQKYLRLVLQAVVHNPIVAETFFQVQHMVAPGTELFRPRIIFQVLASKLWPYRSTRVTHAGEPATYP